MVYHTCTEVTPQCPVEATTYGYRPNMGGNIFFCVVFGICCIAQLVLGIMGRLRGFTFAVTVGCFGECVGYAGRLIMHNNPWSQTGFKIQIVCLILSPSFLAAGIYLTIKHLVLHYGAQYSRLKPTLYTWIFICADAASILIQAAGGGIASGREVNLINIGDSIMVAGICVQVATMAVCGILALDFFFRRNRYRRSHTESEIDHPRSTTGFKYYVCASAIAFLTIFIRSIYRIPEMAGGWGNPLMQNEDEFLALDGMMVAIAAIAMTVAHPGVFFPGMKSKKKTPETEDKQNVGLDSLNTNSDVEK